MTRFALSKAGAGLTLLTVLAAGCFSPSVPGEPTADASQPTASGSASSSVNEGANVPKVARPLDASSYLKNPCALVPDNQVAALGVNGKAHADLNETANLLSGPGCTWVDVNAYRTVGVGFLVKNKHGLADIYTLNSRGAFAYFEPIVIDGYPGALADNRDKRDNGQCNAAIALNDRLTMSVSMIGGDGRLSCEDVKHLGGVVLRTLKENQ